MYSEIEKELLLVVFDGGQNCHCCTDLEKEEENTYAVILQNEHYLYSGILHNRQSQVLALVRLSCTDRMSTDTPPDGRFQEQSTRRSCSFIYQNHANITHSAV